MYFESSDDGNSLILLDSCQTLGEALTTPGYVLVFRLSMLSYVLEQLHSWCWNTFLLPPLLQVTLHSALLAANMMLSLVCPPSTITLPPSLPPL